MESDAFTVNVPNINTGEASAYYVSDANVTKEHTITCASEVYQYYVPGQNGTLYKVSYENAQALLTQNSEVFLLENYPNAPEVIGAENITSKEVGTNDLEPQSIQFDQADWVLLPEPPTASHEAYTSFAQSQQVPEQQSTFINTEVKLLPYINQCQPVLNVLENKRRPGRPRLSSIKKSVAYNCIVCQEAFTAQRLLNTHMEIHANVKEFKCPSCEACFNHDVNLQLHVLSKHSCKSATSLQCPVCKITITRHSAFVGHLKTHETDDDVSCEKCNERFKSSTILKAHLILCKNKSDEILQRLNNEIMAMNPMRCRICGSSFASSGLLRIHYLQHHPESIKKKCSTTGNMTRPVEPVSEVTECTSQNSHSSMRKSKVRAMNFLTSMSKNIGESSAKKDDKIKLTHVCSVCTAVFPKKALLIRHFVRHTKEKHFICEICHKRLTQKSSLKTHMKVHTREYDQKRQAQCQLSHNPPQFKQPLVVDPANTDAKTAPLSENLEKKGSKLTKLSSLLVSGNRSFMFRDINIPSLKSKCYYRFYRCRFCFALVKHRSVWLAHLRRHRTFMDSRVMTRVKPPLKFSRNSRHFICSICDRSFTSAIFFKFHKKVHEQSLSRPLIWNKHLRKLQPAPVPSTCPSNRLPTDVPTSDIPSRPHKCTHCDKSYKCNHHLQFHIRQRHSSGVDLSTCLKCGRRYTSTLRLYSHMKKVHSKDHEAEKYTCTVCNVRVGSNRSLNRHMKQHENSSTFLCPLCQAQFKSYVLCQRHIRTHPQESFAICDNAATNASLLEVSSAKDNCLGMCGEVSVVVDLNQMESHHQAPTGAVIEASLCPLEYAEARPQEVAEPNDFIETVNLNNRPVYFCNVLNECTSFEEEENTVGLLGQMTQQHSFASTMPHQPTHVEYHSDEVTIGKKHESNIITSDIVAENSVSLPNICNSDLNQLHPPARLLLDNSLIVTRNLANATQSNVVTTESSSTENGHFVLSHLPASDIPLESADDSSFMVESSMDTTLDSRQTTFPVAKAYPLMSEVLFSDDTAGGRIANLPTVNFMLARPDESRRHQDLHQLDDVTAIAEPSTVGLTAADSVYKPSQYAYMLSVDTADANQLQGHTTMPPLKAGTSGLSAGHLVTELELPSMQPEQFEAMPAELRPETIPLVGLFACGRCQATFNSASQLRLHAQVQHGPQKRVCCCDYCQRRFVSLAGLITHQMTHEDQAHSGQTDDAAGFTCPVCATLFDTRGLLLQHASTEHPARQPPAYQCAHCGAGYRSVRSLASHVASLSQADQLEPDATLTACSVPVNQSPATVVTTLPEQLRLTSAIGLTGADASVTVADCTTIELTSEFAQIPGGFESSVAWPADSGQNKSAGRTNELKEFTDLNKCTVPAEPEFMYYQQQMDGFHQVETDCVTGDGLFDGDFYVFAYEPDVADVADKTASSPSLILQSTATFDAAVAGGDQSTTGNFEAPAVTGSDEVAVGSVHSRRAESLRLQQDASMTDAGAAAIANQVYYTRPVDCDPAHRRQRTREPGEESVSAVRQLLVNETHTTNRPEEAGEIAATVTQTVGRREVDHLLPEAFSLALLPGHVEATTIYQHRQSRAVDLDETSDGGEEQQEQQVSSNDATITAGEQQASVTHSMGYSDVAPKRPRQRGLPSELSGLIGYQVRNQRLSTPRSGRKRCSNYLPLAGQSERNLVQRTAECLVELTSQYRHCNAPLPSNSPPTSALKHRARAAVDLPSNKAACISQRAIEEVQLAPVVAARKTESMGNASHSETAKSRSDASMVQYVCEVCGRSFPQRWQLTRHTVTHSGERRFGCAECGAVFSQAATLTRHQQLHGDKRRFRCRVCGVVFTQRSNLTRHISNVHIN